MCCSTVVQYFIYKYILLLQVEYFVRIEFCTLPAEKQDYPSQASKIRLQIRFWFLKSMFLCFKRSSKIVRSEDRGRTLKIKVEHLHIDTRWLESQCLNRISSRKSSFLSQLAIPNNIVYIKDYGSYFETSRVKKN